MSSQKPINFETFNSMSITPYNQHGESPIFRWAIYIILIRN